MEKVENLLKQRDELAKDLAVAESKKQELEEAIKEVGKDIKERFGTTDLEELDEICNDLSNTIEKARERLKDLESTGE